MKQIPQNSEHLDAAQKEIDAKRLAHLESLSPADKKRFLAMEKAVSLLEKHEIQYILFAFPEINSPGIWQFNKSTYCPDPFSQTGNEQSRHMLWKCLGRMTKFFAEVWHFRITCVAENGETALEVDFKNELPK